MPAAEKKQRPKAAEPRPLTPEKPPPTHVPPDCITTAGAAKILGLKRDSIRYLVDEGKLTAVRDAAGVRLFRREDVLEYCRIRGRRRRDKIDAEASAAVFDCFERGLELPEIVRRTNQSPMTIRALYAEFVRPLREPRRLPAPIDGDALARELHSAIDRFTEATMMGGKRA